MNPVHVLSRWIPFGALALTLVACGGKEAPKSPPAQVPAASSEGTAAPAQAHPVSAAYETLRKALVNDDFAAAKAAGKALAEAAKGHDDAITRAAASIPGSADIAALRLAFGETSKAFITWLDKTPAQAAGMHAFQCPMALGYKKWVQPTDAIDNPYMGQRMLKCGGPTELTP